MDHSLTSVESVQPGTVVITASINKKVHHSNLMHQTLHLHLKTEI